MIQNIATLIDKQIERERLPSVGVTDVRIAHQFWTHWVIDWFVILIFVLINLIGTILEAKLNDLIGDVIAQCGSVSTTVV